MTQADAENSTTAPGGRTPPRSFNTLIDEPFTALGDPDQGGMPLEVRDAIATLRRARAAAADQIEKLLGFLDETEMDFEENEIDAVFRARFGPEPFEDELEDREPDVDDEWTADEEPSLGSLSSTVNQSRWGFQGEGGIDCEDEHDGSEDGGDLEIDRADYEHSPF